MWLNGTFSFSTVYSPVELIFDILKLDPFEEFLKEGTEQNPLADSLQKKMVLKAYVKMTQKAEKGNKP
jgi:hypothetical protein